ncbi:MAG TPA: hypothetical protein PKD85_19770, partial [Saprospiraceae bacterium]|nr:hypothetical protein [Saprospiraceae bacterium]
VNTSYADTDLMDGAEYCYYVVGSGSYNIPFIGSPLFNASQRSCAIPTDNRAPCPPRLTVINLCDQIQTSNIEDLKNFLSWTDPNANCPYIEAVASYRVYYSPDSLSVDELLVQIPSNSRRSFEH